VIEPREFPVILSIVTTFRDCDSRGNYRLATDLGGGRASSKDIADIPALSLSANFRTPRSLSTLSRHGPLSIYRRQHDCEGSVPGSFG
jgi:hypothetical protein